MRAMIVKIQGLNRHCNAAMKAHAQIRNYKYCENNTRDAIGGHECQVHPPEIIWLHDGMLVHQHTNKNSNANPIPYPEIAKQTRQYHKTARQ